MDEGDEEVDLPTEENTIIPGTWGYAEIKIENAGNVAADITIEGLASICPNSPGKIDYTNAALVFCVVDKELGDSYPGDDSSNFEDENFVTEDPEPFTLNPGESKSFYVCYKWEYNGDSDDPMDDANEADTKIQSHEFSFGTLTVTAQQAKISTESP